MIKTKEEYYQILVDNKFKGQYSFFIAVKSAGLVYNYLCNIEDLEFNDCEFFEYIEDALLLGYKFCSKYNQLSKEILDVLEMIENNSITEKDLKNINIDTQIEFEDFFKISILRYVKARRMGIPLSSIVANNFNGDVFTEFLDIALKKSLNVVTLYTKLIDTKLGMMICISDNNYLYLLEFLNRDILEQEIRDLKVLLNAEILIGDTDVSVQLEKELHAYFNKELEIFTVPIKLTGTDFQNSVWKELLNISLSEVVTYQELANKLNIKNGARAVGSANRTNKIAIIVPCHRVIRSDKSLANYGGGVYRKEWLIKHESEFI